MKKELERFTKMRRTKIRFERNNTKLKKKQKQKIMKVEKEEH